MADNNLDLFEKKDDTQAITPKEKTGSIQGLDLFEKDEELDLFSGEKIKRESLAERNTNAIKEFSQVTPEEDDYQNEEKDVWNKIAEGRFSPERVKWMKENPIGFGEQGDFLQLNQIMPFGEYDQAVDIFGVKKISDKYARGEQLTKAEEDKMFGFLDKQAEMQIRGFTIGGGISYAVPQAPAFLASFGLGKLGVKAATKGLAKTVAGNVAKNIARNAAKRGVTRVGLKAVTATAKASGVAALMQGRTLTTYGERRLGDLTVSNKGDLFLKDVKESKLKSYLLAHAYTTAEAGSEMAGETIGKFLVEPAVKVATAVLKTPLTQAVNVLPNRVKSALYAGLKATKPNTKVSRAFSAVGWEGFLEEMTEEELNNVLNAGIGLIGEEGYTLENAIDEIEGSLDERLIAGGTIGTIKSVSVGANVVFNRMQNKGMLPEEAEEVVRNLDEKELDNQILEEFPLPQSEYDTRLDDALDTATLDGNIQESLTESEARSGVIALAQTNDQLDIIQEQIDLSNTIKVETKQEQGSTSSIQAGVSNIDIQSNQEIEPPLVLDQESGFNNGFKPIIEKAKEVKDWVIFELVNDKRMLESLSPNIQQSIRSFHGIAGKIRQNLQVGIYGDVDGERQIVGKSLKNITDDWNNYLVEFEPSMEQRLKDQDDYLRSRRILEDLIDREDVEVTETQKIKAMTDMARLNDKYKDNMGWFETFSQELYENQRQILHQLVDVGVMSEDSFKAITKSNPNYVPFNRIIEDDTFIGFSKKAKFTDAKAGIEKIKGGSDLEVDNFLRNITLNSGKIIVAAEKNKIASDIKDVMLSMGLAEKSKPLLKEKTVDGKKVLKPSKQKPKGTMSVFEDGERVFYKVPENILREIEATDPNVNSFMAKLLKPVEVTSDVMRAGATGLNPEFWAKNFIRDTIMVNLQSKVNPNAVDAAKGVFVVLGKSDVYNKWEEAGGSFDSYMGQNLKDMDNNLEDIYKEIFRTGGKVDRYLKNPLKTIEDIGDVVEKANRLGVFQKSLSEGLSEKESTFESRDASLDFAVAGRTGRVINRYIPFFNAGIRGTAKLADTLRKNPTAFMYQGITRLTLPTIMYNYYMLYEAPDDEREEYLELPNWRRMIAWNIKINDFWVSIPKPFAPGQLFATIPEMLMIDGFKGDKPESRDMAIDIIKNVVGSLSPIQDLSGVMPPLMKWSIENMTNHNFFTGRSLYPEWMDRLEPRDRANKYTPETLKLLGDKLNISPAKLDNALKGTFAGSARFFTDASDKVLQEVKEWNGEKFPDKPRELADIPFIRSLVKRSPDGFGSKSVQNFFADWTEAQQVHASFNRRKGEERKRYFERNKDVILSYKPLKAFNKQMKSIRDQIDIIYNSKTMSAEQKVEKINKLEKKITDIARTANKQQLKRKTK